MNIFSISNTVTRAKKNMDVERVSKSDFVIKSTARLMWLIFALIFSGCLMSLIFVEFYLQGIPPSPARFATAALNAALATIISFWLLHRNARLLAFLLRQAEETQSLEREVRRYRKHYHFLFDHALTGNYISKPDGSIESCNASFARILRFKTIEDALNVSATDLYHDPKDRDVLLELIRKRRLLEDHEIDLVRHDGKKISVILNVVGDFNRWGRLQKIHGYVIDISERKRAELALRESEKRFKQIVEKASDVFYRADASGRITYANPIAKEITGYSEIVGRHFLELIREKDKREVQEFYKNQVRDGVLNTYREVPVTCADGKEIWIGQNVQMLVAEGKCEGFQAVARDITQRRQSDEVKDTLYEIANAATMSSNLVELYRSIHFHLSKLIDTKNFYIAVHQTADFFTFPYIIDETLELEPEFTPQEISRGLTAYVFKTQQPLLADESVLNVLEKNGEIDLVGAPCKIWMGVPLKTDRGVIGVMVVQSYDDAGLYAQKELDLMTFVSDQVASAMERKKAESRIAEQAALLNRASDAIFVLNFEEVITYWNHGAEELYGKTANDAVGTSVLDLLSIDGELMTTALQDTIENGDWKGEIEHETAAGEKLVVNSHWTLVRDEQLNQESILVIDTDITEKREIQAQLFNSEKMAGLGQLISGVAHEINTPASAIASGIKEIERDFGMTITTLIEIADQCTAESRKTLLEAFKIAAAPKKELSTRNIRRNAREIQARLEAAGMRGEAHSVGQKLAAIGFSTANLNGLASLIAKGPGKLADVLFHLGMGKVHFRDIDIAVSRITSIIKALKYYSHIDSGTEIETCLRDDLDNTLIILHNQLKNGIQVHREYDSVPPIKCHADQLNQVWTNLIHNAIQAMSGKGDLFIRLRHNEANMMIEIEDTGGGIPEAIRTRLFKPYFTTKRAGEGTGMGLYISRQIVEKHHGRIELISKELGRTCFRVTLPLAPESDKPKVAIESSTER